MDAHLYRCPDCKHYHFAYHSCNNRNCPQCGQADQQAWLEKQIPKLLLNCDYYMVTFTIPAELRIFFLKDPKLYNALFNASSQAIKNFASNPKWLGAETGIFSVLHTWTRQLIYHPHIHSLVPAGGLSLDEKRWVTPKVRDKLFMHHPFMIHYRGLLRNQFREFGIEDQVPREVWNKDWRVDFKQVSNGYYALNYLARYVNKTAISNSRILSYQNRQVTFKHIDSNTGERKIKRLPDHEFIDRFLQHILPSGFMRIRYYGLFHHLQRGKFAIAQKYLGTVDEKCKKEIQPTSIISKTPLCKECQVPMERLGNIKNHKIADFVARMKRTHDPP